MGAQLGDRVLPFGQIGPMGVDTLAAFAGHGSSSRSRERGQSPPLALRPGQAGAVGGRPARTPFWRTAADPLNTAVQDGVTGPVSSARSSRPGRSQVPAGSP